MLYMYIVLITKQNNGDRKMTRDEAIEEIKSIKEEQKKLNKEWFGKYNRYEYDRKFDILEDKIIDLAVDYNLDYYR